MRAILPCAIFAVLFGSAASASDPALGKWRTEPDRKGQVGIVNVHECAEQKLCGRIVAARDPGGDPVVTPNVGKMVFWDMRPTEPGHYEGMAWVPARDAVYRAGMRLMGNRLKVRGCLGPICQSQVWTRVK